jgi:hypothetical protein
VARRKKIFFVILVFFVNFVVPAAGCRKAFDAAGAAKKKARAPAEAEARADDVPVVSGFSRN